MNTAGAVWFGFGGSVNNAKIAVMKPARYIRIGKFLFAGGLAAVTEYMAFWLLTTLLGDGWLLMSQTLSFLLGFIVSFILNRSWVFQNTAKVGSQLLKYGILAAVNLVLSNGLIWILGDIAGIHHLVAKIVVMAAVACWNYLLFSRLIFKSTV